MSNSSVTLLSSALATLAGLQAEVQAWTPLLVAQLIAPQG